MKPESKKVDMGAASLKSGNSGLLSLWDILKWTEKNMLYLDLICSRSSKAARLAPKEWDLLDLGVYERDLGTEPQGQTLGPRGYVWNFTQDWLVKKEWDKYGLLRLVYTKGKEPKP